LPVTLNFFAILPNVSILSIYLIAAGFITWCAALRL